MPAASGLRYVYFAYLSKPAADRALYRLIRRRRVRRIVELGIGSLERTRRLLQTTLRYAPEGDVHYAGIDLFDARESEHVPLSLKEAYRHLKPIGLPVQLIPGDPLAALRRSANSLRSTDLLLISRGQNLDAAWFFVPRLLHEGAVVLQQRESDEQPYIWQAIGLDEIDRKSRAVRRAA